MLASQLHDSVGMSTGAPNIGSHGVACKRLLHTTGHLTSPTHSITLSMVDCWFDCLRAGSPVYNAQRCIPRYVRVHDDNSCGGVVGSHRLTKT